MSNALHELLAEYAEQAPAYDVGSRALAAGRRRRALRRATPVAITLMLLAGVILIWPRGSTGGGSALISPAESGLAGYPSVIAPRPDAPPLPADRAVGTGVLVYPVRDGGYVLVTGDGTQYRLDPAATDYRLSADGRWLAGSVPDRAAVVRDLTGTGSSRELPGSPIAWSPDGRWLALGPPLSTEPRAVSDNPGTVWVADLSRPDVQPRAVDLSGFHHTRVMSVRADGDLVLRSSDSDVRLDLSLVDPATATVRRHIDLDLMPFLTRAGPGASATFNYVFGSDGLVYVHAERPLDGEQPGGYTPYYPVAVLPVDIGTGSGVALSEWRLPEPRPASGGMREYWMLLRVLPEGMLLRHMTPGGTLSWDLYQPRTGLLTTVTDLRAVGLK